MGDKKFTGTVINAFVLSMDWIRNKTSGKLLRQHLTAPVLSDLQPKAEQVAGLKITKFTKRIALKNSNRHYYKVYWENHLTHIHMRL